MRKAVLIALAVVAVVVLVPVVIFGLFVFASTRGDCSDREARVFSEFPQYGGRRVEPEESTSQDACFTEFTTEDPSSRVRGYYRRQLTAHGWKLDPEDESEFAGLTGRRPPGFGDQFMVDLVLEPNNSPPGSLRVQFSVVEVDRE